MLWVPSFTRFHSSTGSSSTTSVVVQPLFGRPNTLVECIWKCLSVFGNFLFPNTLRGFLNTPSQFPNTPTMFQIHQPCSKYTNHLPNTPIMFQIHQPCSKYTNHVPNTSRQVLPNTLIKFSNTLLDSQLISIIRKHMLTKLCFLSQNHSFCLIIFFARVIPHSCIFNCSLNYSGIISDY